MEARTDAMISAQRCWQAALEHLDLGDFKTAGTLIRAVGRYVERMDEGKSDATGEVVPFPSFHALGGALGRACFG